MDITVTTDGKVYAEEISLANSTTMIVGDTKTLSISYSPSTTTEKSVTWTSSDPSVVSVDQNGLLTAVKKGTAEITATVATEEGTVSDTCTVTVRTGESNDISPADQTGEFTIEVTSEGTGAYEQDGNVYTITQAGEYTLSGNLVGEIVVNAGSDDEVTIVLNGVTITYSENSPILVTNAGEVTVKAAKGTENTIYDNRETKTVDSDTQGE